MDDREAVRLLHVKVDSLAEQTTALMEWAEEQKRRHREWGELKADLVPIAQDAFVVTVEQLSEIEGYVRLEDVLHLLKRLARNTRTIEQALDQLESLRDLLNDLAPISKDAFVSAVEQLDDLERRGYFDLLRETRYVLDNVAQAFGPDDVRQLGDNIVAILTAVRQMTQPELMELAQSIATRIGRSADPATRVSPSPWGLVGQLRDPRVRRGLAIALDMLRAMGEESSATESPSSPDRAGAKPADVEETAEAKER